MRSFGTSTAWSLAATRTLCLPSPIASSCRQRKMPPGRRTRLRRAHARPAGWNSALPLGTFATSSGPSCRSGSNWMYRTGVDLVLSVHLLLYLRSWASEHIWFILLRVTGVTGIPLLSQIRIGVTRRASRLEGIRDTTMRVGCQQLASDHHGYRRSFAV